MDEKTVPCEDCGKPIRMGVLTDGIAMTLKDGRGINLCHRCSSLRQGFSPEDIDAVYKP